MSIAWATNKQSAVVLFSGGMDSTWCLYQAKAIYHRVHAIALDYGQSHAEYELLSARRIAAKLSVPLAVCSIRINSDAALCSDKKLETGVDDAGNSRAFVPGRNLHFLTVAGAHALKVDANVLVIGCCADDAGGFPDCRPEFMAAAQSAVSAALARSFTIEAPLLKTFKVDLAASAPPSLRALLDESWSCYTPAPGGVQCGQCDACALRIRALGGAA